MKLRRDMGLHWVLVVRRRPPPSTIVVVTRHAVLAARRGVPQPMPPCGSALPLVRGGGARGHVSRTTYHVLVQ